LSPSFPPSRPSSPFLFHLSRRSISPRRPPLPPPLPPPPNSPSFPENPSSTSTDESKTPSDPPSPPLPRPPTPTLPTSRVKNEKSEPRSTTIELLSNRPLRRTRKLLRPNLECKATRNLLLPPANPPNQPLSHLSNRKPRRTKPSSKSSSQQPPPPLPNDSTSTTLDPLLLPSLFLDSRPRRSRTTLRRGKLERLEGPLVRRRRGWDSVWLSRGFWRRRGRGSS